MVEKAKYAMVRSIDIVLCSIDILSKVGDEVGLLYYLHLKDNIAKQIIFRSKYISILEVVIDANRFYDVPNFKDEFAEKQNKLNLN